MAGRTITQRISLVGGDEIKVQLQGLGQAGELAFTRLTAAANSGSAFSKFGASLAAVQAKMATVAAAGQKVGSALTSVGEAIGRAGARIGIVAGVGLAGAAKSLLDVAKGAGETQEALDNNAAALGVNAKELDTFQKVAGLAGIGGDTLQKALLKVNAAANEQVKSDRTLAKTKRDLFKEFQQGNITYDQYWKALKKVNDNADEGNDVFTRLGVSYKNADGTVKDSLTLFKEMGAALSQVQDGTKRSGLAMDAFGTRNAKVTRLSVLSAEEFRKQAEEIQRLTPALEDAEREGLSNFGDRLELLGKVFDTTRDKLFAIFAPSLTGIINAVIERVAGAREGILAVAQDLESKFQPIAADIIAAIEGRDADVKNSSILKFRDGVIQAGQDIKGAVIGIIAAFKGLKALLDVIADGINAVFGTKLTGGEIIAAAALLRLTGLFGLLRASVGAAVAVIEVLVVAFGGIPVAIAAAGFALGFFIVQGIQKLGGLQAIATQVLQGIPIIIGRVLAGIPILIGQAVNGIVGFVSGVVETVTGLWGNVSQLFSAGVESIASLFATLPQRIADIFNAIVQFFVNIWNAIVQGATNAGQGIADALRAGVNAAIGFVKGLYDSVVGYFQGILEKAASVGQAISDAFSGGGGGGDGPQANAEGGHIRGRGTGTSDSILSWLSNGEFVLKAKRVRQYGLGFLHALNEGRFKMPRFASGGLVNMASAMLPSVPRFAAGGLVMANAAGSGGRPFTLQIGSDVFSGLSASDATVDRLQKYATRKNVHSAGRKPTWFQG